MMTAKRPHVIIYTDGGCKPNPGPGGWGVLLLWGIDYAKELSGAEPHTTNNRMELTAAIEALRALKRPCDVTLHTDSEYLQQGITSWLPDWIARGWRRKGNRPVENEDLWRALHAETQRHTISWRWVKGHAGDAHNERVDQLATQARERLLQQIDSPASAAFDPDYEIALRISLPKNSSTGGWAARIAARDGDSQDTISGRLAASSSNRLWLLAALEALRHIPEGASVRVFAPDSYLVTGITRWVKGWRAHGWKTKSGSPVKNRDAWEALATEADQRIIRWVQEGKEPVPLAADLSKLAADAARNNT